MSRIDQEGPLLRFLLCFVCFVLLALLCIVSSDLYCLKDPYASCSLKYFGLNYRRRMFLLLLCFVAVYCVFCFVFSPRTCIVQRTRTFLARWNILEWIIGVDFFLRCVQMNLATTALSLVILPPIFVDPGLLTSSIEFGHWLTCAWLSSVTFVSLTSSMN